MDTVMVRERYKIVRVLEAENDYAFAESVDITERETPVRLLNIYEGDWLPVYARIYSGLEGCAAFCETFLAEDSLVAVFQPCGGVPIDRVFFRGAEWSWQDRLTFTEQLLHQALEMTDLPPAVSCAAMFSDNVRVDPVEKRVMLRFRIRPMEEMNARELALLASDHVRKILAPRFQQGDAEYDFCRMLAQGGFLSIVPLYACWHRMREQITAEYEALDKKNAIKRWFTFLWKNLKRLFGRKRR